jgi:hypothetical protein
MRLQLFARLILLVCLFSQAAVTGAAGSNGAPSAMTREGCAFLGDAEFAQCRQKARTRQDSAPDACIEARQLKQRRCMLDVLENLNRAAGVAPTRRWQGSVSPSSVPGG